MDIDLLKSTPDDQIEMMLMMHMEKSGSDFADSPITSSFSGGGHGPHHPNSNMGQLFGAVPPTLSFNSNGNAQTHQNSMVLPDPSFGHHHTGNGNNNLFHSLSSSSNKQTSMAAMREMIFRIAAMQPIYIDPESVKPPKRRNVRISKDPQSVAARHRRERISERIRILQRLVPGGTKMDTASMLDEAIHYVKFLKTQVQSLERAAVNRALPVGFPVPGNGYNSSLTGGKATNYPLAAPAPQNVLQFSDA